MNVGKVIEERIRKDSNCTTITYSTTSTTSTILELVQHVQLYPIN